MRKLFDDTYIILGIIEPTSLFPYFRMYNFLIDKIVDIPCCIWHMYGKLEEDASWITLACSTKNLPVYANGVWSKQGYYFLYSDKTQVQITDLFGNMKLISKADAARLIQAGQVFNVMEANGTYPLGYVRNFKIGDVCYQLVTKAIMHSNLCTVAAAKSVCDSIALRAKMLGVHMSRIDWTSWATFGTRLVNSMDIPPLETFYMPSGITEFNPQGLKPMPQNLVINNPMFGFDTYNYKFNLNSLLVTDAFNFDIKSTMTCNLLKVRSLHAMVRTNYLQCKRLMLWGTKSWMSSGYDTHLFIRGNNVSEMILYHVTIHDAEEICLNPDTKIILCDCDFEDPYAKEAMKQAVEISEQEMLALWDLPPSILDNRLCIPGI